MPKKRDRSAKPAPQRFTWTTLAVRATYLEANSQRNALKKDGRNVKVRLRHDGFRVVEGTPLKKKGD